MLVLRILHHKNIKDLAWLVRIYRSNLKNLAWFGHLFSVFSEIISEVWKDPKNPSWFGHLYSVYSEIISAVWKDPERILKKQIETWDKPAHQIFGDLCWWRGGPASTVCLRHMYRPVAADIMAISSWCVLIYAHYFTHRGFVARDFGTVKEWNSFAVLLLLCRGVAWKYNVYSIKLRIMCMCCGCISGGKGCSHHALAPTAPAAVLYLHVASDRRHCLENTAFDNLNH